MVATGSSLGRRAIRSISTRPLGQAATCTVLRAGGLLGEPLAVDLVDRSESPSGKDR